MLFSSNNLCFSSFVQILEFSRGLLIIWGRFITEYFASCGIVLFQMCLGVPLVMFLGMLILSLEQGKWAQNKLVENGMFPTTSSSTDNSCGL